MPETTALLWVTGRRVRLVYRNVLGMRFHQQWGAGTESVPGDLGGQKGGEEEGPGNPTSTQMGELPLTVG